MYQISIEGIRNILKECWKNNVLLIGISIDTAVHEFKNHVMPICINNSIWPNCSLTQDDINNIPNTDRMLLQFLSMFNHDKILLPWALIEYDSAFMMAIQIQRNLMAISVVHQKIRLLQANSFFVRLYNYRIQN